jgi:hypothetical protein
MGNHFSGKLKVKIYVIIMSWLAGEMGLLAKIWYMFHAEKQLFIFCLVLNCHKIRNYQ